ncbi:protease modulator HflC [Rhodanobacter glycinis]|uniref:Protein HflC n=1 Tax=Rhodanobacter glycinis TaxID=582702 RepID=A0A5B9E0F0_9GAMM|nr:protease modulator HflC [Rhodanobacter glycinis]QEE25229.1 protease modulator HflC [Rhodanobacter glycinis]
MKIAAGIFAVVLVLLGFNSMYVVNEGESALVLQFGRIVRNGDQPGLHFKLPLLQQVVHLDSRILTLDAQPERYFTSEKKSVNVDFYVKWRIADNATYYRATGGNELQAVQRLTPIVKDALRHEFNARTLQELISGGRKDITASVRKQTDTIARKNLGIAVVDVRIKRIDLPDEVSESVYKRMRAERLQLANELRSTGQQLAETIQADADKQGQIIRADADRDAAKIRGEGDAQAAAIYAQAYGQDPEFFAFYRSLQAYKKAFADGKGVLILKPDSEFLRYFSNPAPARH